MLTRRPPPRPGIVRLALGRQVHDVDPLIPSAPWAGIMRLAPGCQVHDVDPSTPAQAGIMRLAPGRQLWQSGLLCVRRWSRGHPRAAG